MKELVVVSGKGGTGKTSVSAALAYLAPHKVMVDCDVDAANLHLVSGAVIQKAYPFSAGFEPVIDPAGCTACGKCTEACRFSAITDGDITDPLSCEGCGVCEFVCPAKAVHMREKQAGQWFVANTAYGSLVYAELGISVENSGKLVSKVRQEAKEIANDNKLPLIIVDGPPGIGCPAIAALSGANLALAVVEPSLSSMHDLSRLVNLADFFSLPVAVCINKSSLHRENTQRIIDWCSSKQIPIVGQLPYSDAFRAAVASGRSVMRMEDTYVKEQMSEMWSKLSKLLCITPSCC